ncbi:polysaccharide biosynthesis tyrosine autokinase [Pedobacter sp. HMF7647]|uniref:non-specific protein-tyrosine kinase n=1 Tax=Hufsiella arboris TaxID=2695275 RepID=A0A7K1YFI5_9SPHI|nr:tyrosine-protein kinase family protein [Hufsiella arboris]MXV52838.1 polysaccharide biosynthesis tyrosine autokinase [Hufsiella arboris]
MDQTTETVKKTASQSIDFWKIIKVFLSRWYWIAGCLVISLVIAWLYIWYTPPVYMTFASLKFDDKQGALSNAVRTSPDYSSMGNFTDKIKAESYVIKSNDVILNAIGRLNYKVSYFLKGRVRTTELYPTVPFTVDIAKQDSVNFSRAIYDISSVSSTSFKLGVSGSKSYKTYRYGQDISEGNMIFRVTTPVPSSGQYSFKFNSKYDFMGRAFGINTMEAAKFTNVMNLSNTDQNPVFAADILNAVMKEYVTYDASQRRKGAQQTIDFIDSQLEFLNEQVAASGTDLARYKTQNNVVDLNTNTQMAVGKLGDFEKQKTELNIAELGIRQLETQIAGNKQRIQINFDLEGEIGSLLGGLVTQLNSLIANREQKLTQFNPESAPIKDLDRQINEIKQAIRNNINSLHERNQKTIRYIDAQIAQVNQNLNRLPGTQKEFATLQSKFDINQKVYSYLSEKKLESQISAAAIVPGATIVNLAQPSFFPISPVPRQIYISALLAGLAAGAGLILLIRILNPYIYDKEAVEGLTTTPIIGVIRKFPEYIDQNSKQVLSVEKPKSVFAESVRSVRTNLSFMASHKKSKIICVTSEISGEGKSFITLNLAVTLALIDKKVLLVAADLRKSKLHKAFDTDNKKGLSNYLSGKYGLDEIIEHNTSHGIDFISSGPIPPNPSELLHSDKMVELFAILQDRYDYVLFDTAPVGLVSDAVPMIRNSDINLFVLRSGISQNRAASVPERISREYGLTNVAIVLNAFGDDALHANIYTTDYSRGSGNTYYYSDYSGYSGAGYYEDDKKWWEFWKRGSRG